MSKLALFVPNLRGGGAEKMMVHLANEFSRAGHSCDLVLAERGGTYQSMIAADVNVVNLDTSFRNPLVIYRLGRYLRKAKPDALLTAMTYPNIAALLARKLARVPVRVVVSERIALTVQSASTPKLREKLKPLSARLLYRYADHIVTISKGVADNLVAGLGIDRNRITTIYNPVVTDQERVSHDKPDHPWFFDQSVPVLLAAGRLVRQKDFGTLLRAFSQILKQKPARLIILGEGPERENLEALANSLSIEDAVYMPGYTDKLYAYMQHADLFVLSSAWEGFGNVLVEALACGCPVVSTDCPSGPAEILDGGKYGRLVPTASPDKLAEAILESLDNPIPKDLLYDRAQYFSAQKSAARYLDIMMVNSSG